MEEIALLRTIDDSWVALALLAAKLRWPQDEGELLTVFHCLVDHAVETCETRRSAEVAAPIVLPFALTN